jgi:hypothetical protein
MNFCLGIYTQTVYSYNDTVNVNHTGITTLGCQGLFGGAAEASQNDGYCRCISTAFLDQNKCCMFSMRMINLLQKSELYIFQITWLK